LGVIKIREKRRSTAPRKATGAIARNQKIFEHLRRLITFAPEVEQVSALRFGDKSLPVGITG
jgi:hypothetical protein